MDRCQSFVMMIGGEQYTPTYYLDYNQDVVKVGEFIAYRFGKGVRVGRISTNFLDREYCWVEVAERDGNVILSELEDEIRWTEILCVLRKWK